MKKRQSAESKKIERLKTILREMKRVLIAFSGGVDSTFLLFVARSVLGKDNVLAVTAESESYPASEREQALEMAKKLSANHLIIKTEELKNKEFKKNPANRCYYCKAELFGRLDGIAKRDGYDFVLDGSTYDDLKDLRFGRIAAKEKKIRSPLQETKLKKDDIRRWSKILGLDNWDKPSSACLASRFAYNQTITREGLKSVEIAEDYLKGLGFKQLRVRRHGEIARIEVAPAEIKKLLQKNIREKIHKRLKALGFTYTTLDLIGYRAGSMNEGLDITR